MSDDTVTSKTAGEHLADALAEFDKWVTEHDRQIAEKAWALGKVAGKSVTMRRMSDEPTAPEPSNPYTPPKQRPKPQN